MLHAEGENMRFHDYYRDKGVRDTCHEVKCGNPEVQNKAISIIAQEFLSYGIVDSNTILVPAPQHSGRAEYTYDICKIIAQSTGCGIADILRRKPQESFYRQKKNGKVYEPRYYTDGDLPAAEKYFFVDNVISTGDSYMVAKNLLGVDLMPLVSAVDYGRVKEGVLMDREDMVEFWGNVHKADQDAVKQGFRSSFEGPSTRRSEYAVEKFLNDEFIMQVDVFQDYNEALEYVYDNPVEESYKICRIGYDDYGDHEKEIGSEYVFELPGNKEIKEKLVRREVETFIDGFIDEQMTFAIHHNGLSEGQAYSAYGIRRDYMVNNLINWTETYKGVLQQDYVSHKLCMLNDRNNMDLFRRTELEAKREFNLFIQRLNEISGLLMPKSYDYMIYQLKDTDDLHYHHFASMIDVEKHNLKIEKSNYETVYVGKHPNNISAKLTEIRHSPHKNMTVLDMLYSKFNIDKPDDFVGHSLSVSDVIVLQLHGAYQAYYVDSYGFKEIPNFVNEMSIERENLRKTVIEDPKHQVKTDDTGDKLRLYVDMDGTLAEFKTVDTLEVLYEEGYFRNLKPNEKVVDAVKDIIKNNKDIEVYILSAYLTDSKYALKEKEEWIEQYLPEIPKENQIYLPCGVSKSDFIQEKMGRLNEKDFLLDDYTINLNEWEPPAKGIKLLNGINHTRGTWKNNRVSYDRSPEDMSNVITDMMRYGKVVMDEPIRSPKTI